MIIAQNQPAGSLAGGIALLCLKEAPTLPLQLASRAEQVCYGSEVEEALLQLPCPSLLEERKAVGAALRKRVLRVLEQLAIRGTVNTVVTRSQWLRLLALAKFCARPQDWASPTGPILGASLRCLAEYLGVVDVAEAVAPLLRHGVVALHRPRTNGRRSFRVLCAGTDDERAVGSGWSLAPLILGIDALEALLDTEIAQQRDRRQLAGEIRELLTEANIMIETALPCPAITAFKEQAEDLAQVFAATSVSKVAALAQLRGQCRNLHDCLCAWRAVENDSQEGDTSPLQQGEIPLPIYNPESNQIVSSGSAERESGQGGPSPARSAHLPDPSEIYDAFGIELVGFSVLEIPALFPASVRLSGNRQSDLPAMIRVLCPAIGLPLRHFEQAVGAFGGLAALLMLLLTTERSLDGKIKASPTAYFAGLCRKARTGDLNLGHTIFAMRRAPELSAAQCQKAIRWRRSF